MHHKEKKRSYWVGKFPWRRDRLPTPIFLGFPVGSDSQESACYAGHLGPIPGLGRSPGGGHGNPIQDSGLENPHGQTRLAGYSPWGHQESDTTERLTQHSTDSPLEPRKLVKTINGCTVFSQPGHKLRAPQLHSSISVSLKYLSLSPFLTDIY